MTDILAGLPWYFYAGPVELYLQFDPEGLVPRRWFGPHESKDEAIEKRREWALEQLEIDVDEIIL